MPLDREAAARTESFGRGGDVAALLGPHAMPSARPAADGVGQPIFVAAACEHGAQPRVVEVPQPELDRVDASARAIASMCISRA